MHRPGNHNANRRTHLLHGANLNRRSVRPQQEPFSLRLRLLPRNKQRVLRVACRMVGWKIQRFEVVIVGLDDRTFSDRVPEFLEDADDLVA